MWKVTYAIDSLDTDPTIKFFDLFDYASCWIDEEMSSRISWTVAHCQFQLTEEKYQDLQEIEYSLIRIEEVEKVDPS